MESIQLSFKYTEAEYLAAARLFLWRSRETLIRLVVTFALLSLGLILVLSFISLDLPLWSTISLSLLVAIAFCHGFFFDRDSRQEATFVEMLRRHIDCRLPLKKIKEGRASE